MSDSSERFFPVAEAASLPAGQGRTVFLRGREYALFNLDGEYHAIDNDCPHRGAPLGAGTIDQGLLHCPLHGWAFDPKTGRCETRLGCDLKSYPTKIEGGEVLLCPLPKNTNQS
jgi:nitrite reductase/ring-hydroxylating ferredoxin subunit